MRCPLCGIPFKQEGVYAFECDHEANWYRDWLAKATLALERIAIGGQSGGLEGAPAEAQRALDSINRSV